MCVPLIDEYSVALKLLVGVYCAGPMPVSAVKTGNVQLGYDGSFIFAEVNADKIHWCQTEENTWRKVIEKSKYAQRFLYIIIII